MRVLLFGATGGCGQHALLELLARGVAVTALVRSEAGLPEAAKGHALLSAVVVPSVVDVSADEMAGHVRGCDAVVSCLGHKAPGTSGMTLKAIYKEPRRLCRDAAKLAAEACRTLQPAKPIKLIAINTAGVDHPGGGDPPRGRMERLVLWLLQQLVPPHADNVETAAYLHAECTANPHVEYCAVRPDDMVDGEKGEYTVHETLQNGLFNAGVTTRSNVGHFMADLVTEADVWSRWKGKHPQLLNVVEKKE